LKLINKKGMNWSILFGLIISVIIIAVFFPIITGAIKIIFTPGGVVLDNDIEQARVMYSNVDALLTSNKDVISRPVRLRIKGGDHAIALFDPSNTETELKLMWPDKNNKDNIRITGSSNNYLQIPKECKEDNEYKPCLCLYKDKPDLNDYNKMADGDGIAFCEIFDNILFEGRTIKFYTLGWTMEDLKPLENGGDCMLFNRGVIVNDLIIEEMFLKTGVIKGDSTAASRLFTYPSTNIVEWKGHPIQFFGSGKNVVAPGTPSENLDYHIDAGECGLYSFQMTKIDTGDAIHIVITEPDAADFLKNVLFANKLCPDGEYSDICWEYGKANFPDDKKCGKLDVCLYNDILECEPACWDDSLTDDEVEEKFVFEYNQKAHERQLDFELPEFKLNPIPSPIRLAGDEQELPTSPFTPQS